MSKEFDVVVIGGGPGGYIAAIRAAQLGLQTACVDDWTRDGGKPALGGTCTNVGCIPSKALLQSSENHEHVGHAYAEHGIQVKELTLDLAQMLKRKDRVVRQNNDGIVYLFRKNKVTFFHGRGSFARAADARWEINVAGGNAETIRAKHVIIATVPSVTIAPVARGTYTKVKPTSRYFPYYTRPWIADDDFNPKRDPHITEDEARDRDQGRRAHQGQQGQAQREERHQRQRAGAGAKGGARGSGHDAHDAPMVMHARWGSRGGPGSSRPA